MGRTEKRTPTMAIFSMALTKPGFWSEAYSGMLKVWTKCGAEESGVYNGVSGESESDLEHLLALSWELP